MYIAVVGDLHGLVWEALRLAVRLEVEIGERLAGVLCTGDLGYFPDVNRLDRGTTKYAREDPDELGFLARFVRRVPEVEQWLAGLDREPPPLYFVRGNHEDHFALERLDGKGRPTTLDAYGLIHYLPDGAALTFRGDGREAVRVTGVGGIELCNPRKYHPLRKIQEASAEALLNRAPGSVDVLLTHDAPTGMRDLVGEASRRPGREWGSEIVSLVAEHLRPVYHFFGHWHLDLPAVALGETTACPMNLVRSRRWQPGPLNHSLGLLRWHDARDHEFSYIQEPWLEEWRWAPMVRLDDLPAW